MRTVDFRYSISDERLLAYAQVPLIDRLRWLDELVRFTLLWRAAPRIEAPEARVEPSSQDPDEQLPG